MDLYFIFKKILEKFFISDKPIRSSNLTFEDIKLHSNRRWTNSFLILIEIPDSKLCESF